MIRLLFVVFVMFAFSACSGGGSDSSTTPVGESFTQDQTHRFVAELNGLRVDTLSETNNLDSVLSDIAEN